MGTIDYKSLVTDYYSTNTDKNILDNSYQLVTHFPDFPLGENRIAYFR